MTIDVLIRGGRVVDGSGAAGRPADLAIEGQRVLDAAPPGTISAGRARQVVDAAGMVVCPGFIDLLSHSIVPLMIDPACLSKITQGVTTEVMGEAWTPAPVGGHITDPMRGNPMLDLAPEWRERAAGWARFGDWLSAMEQRGVAPNIASFLGGGTLRQHAMGMAMAPAGEAELAHMRNIVDDAMRDGALGVSYALIYPPEAYASTDEIVEVCRAVAAHGGVYATHIRSEADRLLDGVGEALEIGRRSGAPVEIYHLKAAGRRNWPRLGEAVRLIEEARATGQDVTADLYPYRAAGTGLTSLLPPWVAADGRLYVNLRDAETRRRARDAALHPNGDWEALGDLAGPEGIMPVGLRRPELRAYNGRRLADIAEERGQHWIDTAIDLLVAEGQRIGAVYFLMSEENVAAELRLPWASVGTDAGGLDPAWAAPLGPVHPRAYGSYPRILGRYVRDEGVLSLEEAVRKMTSAPATRLGLSDRGVLAPGAWADVVIFDPATIRDVATFDDPHRLSEGVRDVWVNGARVLASGQHTRATPGRVLRGPGAR